MTLGTDFSLPEGDGVSVSDGRPGAPPVIVIEYRSHGLMTRLLPAAVVLFAALGISSYQRKTPVWPVIPRPQAPAAGPGLARADDRAAAPTPQVAGAGAATVEVPVPDPVRAETPPRGGSAVARAPVTQPSPFDLDSVDGMPPFELPPGVATVVPPRPPSTPGSSDPRPTSDDPAPAAATVPAAVENPVAAEQPAAEPSRDEILRDIEREGEQKDARRQDLEGLKKNARSLMLQETISKVHADRLAFHAELKQLLTELGDEAGGEIRKLCDRYGKEPIPQVKAAYAKLLRTAPKRLGTAAKVEMMRAVGVPEPLVLDQLCHELDKLMNTRGGPRTEDEVRVRAARKLLSYPLPSASRRVSGSDPDAARAVTGAGARP